MLRVPEHTLCTLHICLCTTLSFSPSRSEAPGPKVFFLFVYLKTSLLQFLNILLYSILFIIEFIGVSKIIEASGAQFCNTSSRVASCAHHPESALFPSPSISIYLTFIKCGLLKCNSHTFFNQVVCFIIVEF